MPPQAENLLVLQMDLPSRSTLDYQEPLLGPKMAAALEEAMREEEEIQVDASSLLTPPPPSPSSSRRNKAG